MINLHVTIDYTAERTNISEIGMAVDYVLFTLYRKRFLIRIMNETTDEEM